MVNIIITDTKESTRFPGKNDLLLSYTLSWLDRELRTLDGVDCHVWYVTRRNSPLKPIVVPFATLHCIQSPDDETSDTHKALFAWLQKHVITSPDETWVQVQLTQPVRRFGLLSDVLTAIDDKNLVLTYAEWDDLKWREVLDKGSLPWDYRQRDEKPSKRYYDGAVAAWRGDVSKLFRLYDENVPKTWVKNTMTPVCDIDSPWQYHNEYLTGLSKLANQNNKLK